MLGPRSLAAGQGRPIGIGVLGATEAGDQAHVCPSLVLQARVDANCHGDDALKVVRQVHASGGSSFMVSASPCRKASPPAPVPSQPLSVRQHLEVDSVVRDAVSWALGVDAAAPGRPPDRLAHETPPMSVGMAGSAIHVAVPHLFARPGQLGDDVDHPGDVGGERLGLEV